MKIQRDDWLARQLGHDAFRLSLGENETQGRCRQAPRVDPALVLAHYRDSSGKAFYSARIPTEEVATVQALNSVGFGVVDVNVTLRHHGAGVAGATPEGLEIVDEIPPGQHGAVLDIAATSFVYSRFHLDPRIPEDTANGIKREWINSYLKGQRGESLLVARRRGAPVGFLAVLAATFEGQPGEGQPGRVIDLIAVDRQQQGSGVGKALVSCFVRTYAASCPVLRVGTQVSNIASMRLYESCGFLMDETSYVMHAHIEDGEVLR